MSHLLRRLQKNFLGHLWVHVGCAPYIGGSRFVLPGLNGVAGLNSSSGILGRPKRDTVPAAKKPCLDYTE